jgi:iron complex outermembrane receptor protein
MTYRHTRTSRARLLLSAALLATSAAWAQDTRLARVEDLSRLSLEELSKIEITSVSKAPQLLNTAAAAVYVITREEIVRAGVLSIPEALRLAPNLQVEQVSSSSYAITARGFGDRRDVQTQANKLLILVDGRTVYSPLFSGVFYDAIDVVMDDIDRIEVISGPGATLWGANAMNGVINIITRSAADTAGGFVRLGAGNADESAAARFGGKIGEGVAYRLYGKAFDRDALELADGTSAHDGWNKRQFGFRLDGKSGRDSWTVQGDTLRADQDFAGVSDITQTGTNVLGRWTRAGRSSQLMVQAYYDRVEREAPPDGAPFSLDTYDVEIQQSLSLGSHQIVWGGGKRVNSYHVTNSGPLQFLPSHRSLDLGNVFVQDTIALGRTLNLTAGVKVEDNPYSDWEALPDLRLSWVPTEATMLWLAASRAIRAPTPFDADVAEFVGPQLFLQGNPDFKSERLWAYEVGYRGRPVRALSLCVSAFYDEYDQLRTVEPGPAVLPLLWDNRMRGDTYGVEAWADIQIRPWWRVSPSLRTLHKRLRFESDASGLVGLGLAGNDPTHQASLKSAIDFGRGFTFDAYFRHVGALPEPQQKEYSELSARLAWRVTKSLEVSVSGFNLLHDKHTEYPVPSGAFIERSVLGEIRVTF